MNASRISSGGGKNVAVVKLAQMPQMMSSRRGSPIAYSVFSPIFAQTRDGRRGVTTVLV
jgi:hypothetical protein